jgi:S1-C subfamily serine protease
MAHPSASWVATAKDIMMSLDFSCDVAAHTNKRGLKGVSLLAILSAVLTMTSVHGQMPQSDPRPHHCTFMADLAERAAVARESGRPLERVIAAWVASYPEAPIEQVRSYATRAFQAPLLSELAAAEAYSTCLAEWAGLGDHRLTRERIDSLTACAHSAATGGAVSCGYTEIAAHRMSAKSATAIPSAVQLSEMSNRFSRSLVLLKTRRKTAMGIVEPNGQFVVSLTEGLESGQDVSVALAEAEPKWQKSQVLGVDSRTHFAVIAPPPTEVEPVRMAETHELVRGQPLIAPGYPSGETPPRLVAVANTEKMLAQTLDRAECWPPFVEYIVDGHTPYIEGPVFDLQGRLVAFGSEYFRPKDNQRLSPNFGYPAATVMQISESVRRYGYWKHGRIGVVSQEVTPALAKTLGMPAPSGAMINSVEINGPAYQAGLRTPDVILAINGQRMARSCQLPAYMATTSPGDVLQLTVWKSKAEVTIPVTAVATLRSGKKPD